MAKQYTAQDIVSIGNVQFVTDNGTITAIQVTAEVNYGTMGMTEHANIWPQLTSIQRDKAQQFYDRLLVILNDEYIG